MVLLAPADMPGEPGLVDDYAGMVEIGAAGDDSRKLVEECGAVLLESGGFRCDQDGVFFWAVGGFPMGHPFCIEMVIT
ncbi:hypothetical protein MWR57_00955 [Desulfovibrionaceae bacterium CB1MN]|uniref:hypothetical protein n=1 Tax=Hydrosulfovibrio ferrireducens TaxID=2934181 RepID=UPI003ABA6ED6